MPCRFSRGHCRARGTAASCVLVPGYFPLEAGRARAHVADGASIGATVSGVETPEWCQGLTPRHPGRARSRRLGRGRGSVFPSPGWVGPYGRHDRLAPAVRRGAPYQRQVFASRSGSFAERSRHTGDHRGNSSSHARPPDTSGLPGRRHPAAEREPDCAEERDANGRPTARRPDHEKAGFTHVGSSISVLLRTKGCSAGLGGPHAPSGCNTERAYGNTSSQADYGKRIAARPDASLGRNTLCHSATTQADAG